MTIKKSLILSTILLLLTTVSLKAQDRFFTKSGSVSFFSYTLVEDIKAENNQVLSVINADNGKLSIKMLMRSFQFKKALMQEHFNENYIESYKFPKATFKGQITNFNELEELTETEIKGVLTIRGISKEVVLKTKIEKHSDFISLIGSFEVLVADFDIKIPSIVRKNISKTIKISFDLDHKPYRK